MCQILPSWHTRGTQTRFWHTPLPTCRHIHKNHNILWLFYLIKSLTRKTAKTQDKYIIAAPKTETSNRKVQLPEVMTKQLEEYFAYKKKNRITSKFLFGGNSPIPQRTYQRYFNYYTQKAELKHIRIHDLRHSHASMLIHLNVPITVISKRLGHSSIKMTLEKYSHCYSDGENIAISAINEAISGKFWSINEK